MQSCIHPGCVDLAAGANRRCVGLPSRGGLSHGRSPRQRLLASVRVTCVLSSGVVIVSFVQADLVVTVRLPAAPRLASRASRAIFSPGR